MSKKVPALKESLRFKMLSAFIAVIIVVLSVFTVFAGLREREKARTGLREQGEMIVELLSRSSVLGVFAENRKMLADAARNVMGLKAVVAVSLYTSDFKEVYAEQKAVPALDTASLLPLTRDDLSSVQSPAVRETGNILEFIGPVLLRTAREADESLYFRTGERDGRQRVIGYVRVALSKEGYHKEIASVVKQNIVVMLAFIISSTAIIYFAVRKVTLPLVKLTEKVRDLGKGLPVEPVPVETGDEVGNLAASFNEMLHARGRAEQSLRESEERYRRLVELSPDGIYVQQHGGIVFINASGTRLLGATDPSQILGTPAIGYIHESYRVVLEKRFVRAEEEGAVLSPLQVRYRQLGGAVVDAEIAIAPFMLNGESAALVIARDQTELKGMEEKIRLYQKELFSVESRVEERERHLIASDLHDYVGQNLAVLNFRIGRLRAFLSSPDGVSHLEAIGEVLEQTIQYTRSLTVELNPPILTELGFKPALESLAEAFQKTHGIRIAIKDDGRSEQVHGETRYLLFRCVRESLMNAVKHSLAKEVVVTVSSGGAFIRITIKDNGIGFDMNKAAGKAAGFGLFSIRERLKRLGGHCEVESAPGQGTKVILAAPARAEDGKEG